MQAGHRGHHWERRWVKSIDYTFCNPKQLDYYCAIFFNFWYSKLNLWSTAKARFSKHLSSISLFITSYFSIIMWFFNRGGSKLFTSLKTCLFFWFFSFFGNHCAFVFTLLRSWRKTLWTVPRTNLSFKPFSKNCKSKLFAQHLA